MTVAAESLVGCEDAVWSVAAPTACAILCSIGESVCVCSLCSMMLSSRMALSIKAIMCEGALRQLCQHLLLSDDKLWSRLVF